MTGKTPHFKFFLRLTATQLSFCSETDLSTLSRLNPHMWSCHMFTICCRLSVVCCL